jgi:pimeloyl-ACP methyl ester carboxylesterase
MTHGFVRANGLRFHYLEEGEPGAPLVLLLHGFPEFSRSWRHQLPALAARGLRVVAPDLRGYHRSDKPEGVGAYDLDLLGRDVVELMTALGADEAALVGHDWGGAIAWHAAMHWPARVRKLAVLDCPHPAAMAQALLGNPRQIRRSGYMFFFQLPLLPERWLRGERLRRFIRGWTHDGKALPDEEIDRLVEAFSAPGVAHAAINYYRAAFRRLPRALRERPPPVRAPTLLLWGEHDRILGLELTRGHERFVAASLRVEIVAGAGHFLQQEAPATVNRLLGDFLTEGR